MLSQFINMNDLTDGEVFSLEEFCLNLSIYL